MQYRSELDGLRAIAVGGVVAVHVGVTALKGGGMGVEVFFALSGYLITHLLLQEEARYGRIDLKSFYMRRILRLAPALVATTFVATVLVALGGLPSSPSFFAAAMALLYLMNFNRAFGWGPQGYLGHTWSLSMEEQFYLLWPVAMLLIPRSARLATLLFLIAAEMIWKGYLLSHGAGIERVYNGLDTHAEILLIGCAAAIVESRLQPAIWRQLSRFTIVPALLLVADFLFMPANTPLGQTAGMLLVGIATVWLVLSLPQEEFLRRALSLAPLVYLGRISYGIYLWHFPVLAGGIAARLPHWGMLTPFVSVAVATASFYVIERPFLRLKTRFPPGVARMTARTADRGLA